jgi:glyoxylase-like metal-dependent hydrolase (beta-lactamase superfamily II)
MIRLADDLDILPGLPPFAFNVYVMGGVVVDAGIRRGARRLLRRLEGRKLSAHALTHAHPDHQGASRAICERFGLPLWCSEADAEAAEVEGVMMDRMPPHWLSRTVGPRWAGPTHPVARRLREGDEVGGFTVLETPGHTVGHISFWREADRTLVLGDVVSHLHIYLGLPMLREPERIFSIDPERNRRSAERLAALGPRLICFGHGPPLRNPRRFARFVARFGDREPAARGRA